MLGLARQQLRFSRRSPAITGQGAIFTHHPVAGTITASEFAAQAPATALPPAAGQYALPPGGSCGSHPPGSAAAPARPAAETRCPADPAAAIPAAGCRRGGRKSRPSADKIRVAFTQLGIGKAPAQVVEQCRIVITRQHRADAALALRHRATTQRAVARGPVTTVAAPPRRNWLAVIPNAASAAIIAAAVGKTSRQRGAGHRYPLLQRFPQALRPPRLLPGFRGHAGDGFK